MKKVLFNTHPTAFYPPGGGEIQILQYQLELINQGYDVKLFNLWKPELEHIKVVHYFACLSGAVHFCQFIRNHGLYLVVSPNLWITEENKNSYSLTDIRNQFVIADRLVCNSYSECENLARVFNIPREKFVTVYNGINEDFFAPVDPELFRSAYGLNSPFVLNVANIEPRKNQLKLIQAIKSFPHLKLVLIGHIRDDDYASICLNEGGDQILHIGSLPHDSELLKSAYAACNVFVLPSTLETPGLAALEASACGAKVVITSEGSAREYFGEGATYINHEDVSSIAQGLACVLAESEDLLATIVMRANFTWSRSVRCLIEVYKDPDFEYTYQADLSGFYPIEYDGFRRFSWSRKTFSFKIPSGRMQFSWRSFSGALVDIYLDGVLFESGLKVDSEWSRFTLKIPEGSYSALRNLLFKVSAPNTEKLLNRDLGVAISEVAHSSFDPIGKFFQGLNSSDFDQILDDAFYPIEYDGFRRFAWSRKSFCFEVPPGSIQFIWRSFSGALVDIYLDGVLFEGGLKVDSEWSHFTLSIPNSSDLATRKLLFRVNAPSTEKELNRNLGVAISDFIYAAN